MTAQNNKISVIVPVYNAEKYLERCIRSVLSQTWHDIELILINDGSTDNSGDICDRYAVLDNRVSSWHIENSGPAFARNIGLDVMSGEYVLFVDADDQIEAEACEILVDVSRRENSDCVIFGIQVDEPEPVHSRIQDKENPKPDNFDKDMSENIYFPETLQSTAAWDILSTPHGGLYTKLTSSRKIKSVFLSSFSARRTPYSV